MTENNKIIFVKTKAQVINNWDAVGSLMFFKETVNIAEKYNLESKMNFLKRKPYESCACGLNDHFPPIRPVLFFSPGAIRTLLQIAQCLRDVD